MILSFHPIVEGDENILCAGRRPDEGDLAAIRRAAAVILPQGCSEPLYRMAAANCPNLFPDLRVRFDYPGKRGQIRFFREMGVPHPATDLYDSVAEFRRRPSAIGLPLVLKQDWGGQGETVFKAEDAPSLARILERFRAGEATGQSGFLVQQFIPSRDRSLRVAVIGRRLAAYWRIAPGCFGASLSGGGTIDHTADPELRQTAEALVRDIRKKARVDLAGFDMLFDARALAAGRIEPLALEINWFFGRIGLGGSRKYYQILVQEVAQWLRGLGLQLPASSREI